MDVTTMQQVPMCLHACNLLTALLLLLMLLLLLLLLLPQGA
jgi:hypothetical protein